MKILNDKYYTPIELANHCWDKVIEIIRKYVSSISAKKISVSKLYEYLKENIPGIE